MSTGGRLTLLRVVLQPRDDEVVRRHPGMATLLHRGDGDGAAARPFYVLPLGDEPRIVEPLSRALSAFTPPGLYRGIGSSWERGIL